MSPELTVPAPEKSSVAADGTWLEYIACGVQFALFENARYTYDDCDGLLKVRYASPLTWDNFRGRGVWHYNATLPFEEGVSLPEGATPLHEISRPEADVGVETLRIKHEGMNPTGLPKDHGMIVGTHVTKKLGIGHLTCASTGGTSAALAAHGTHGGMETLVLLPVRKIVVGKIVQASPHDVRTLEVDGNFNSCLGIIQDLATRGEAYLLNSLNLFHLEGRKTIGLEILEESHESYGSYSDRIVLPVSNVDNTSTLCRAFRELVQSGALDVDDVPKLTGVQTKDAVPMVEIIENGWDETRRWNDVETRVTAIRISNPVSAPKALPGIYETNGIAVAISDEEITTVQHDLATEGVGVEPASTTSVAGPRELRAEGVADAGGQAVYLTTGYLLKDPDVALEASDNPEPVPNDAEAVLEHLVEQTRPARSDRG